MKAKFNERLFSLEKELLSQDYLKFLEYLQNKFDHKRKELFERRQNEQKLLRQFPTLPGHHRSSLILQKCLRRIDEGIFLWSGNLHCG